jgi:prolyl oligopeptidase
MFGLQGRPISNSLSFPIKVISMSLKTFDTKTLVVWMFISLIGMVAAASQSIAQEEGRKVSDVTAAEDPYVWLEDVGGEIALNWVRERNEATVGHFQKDPAFSQLKNDLLTILDSDERIPSVSKRGDYYYNFWRDKKNVRGLWRRTTLASYRQKNPDWEIILDLDALAEAEGENWVWSGASILKPDYDRALINLSRGGADATVTREFDMNTRQFIVYGFQRPEAKGGIQWIDRDNVFVYTDFGPGSVTTSGYPRLAKLWRRGTDLSEATIVYEGRMEDMYISAMHDDSPGFERNFVSRTIAFYNSELYLLNDVGKLVKIEAPNSANKRVFHNYLLLELREPYTVGDKTYPPGSLLVSNFDDFLAGKREFDVAFEPTENSSLSSFSNTKDHLLLNVLEDVKNRIYVLTPTGNGWSKAPLLGAPEIGTVDVSPVDSDESNQYWMTVSDYLNPTTLFLGEVGQQPEQLKQLTPQFNAEGLTVSQHFVNSEDGTRVPYFMIARSDIQFDHSNPTLLYGYGGFEISLLPSYNPGVGKAWLEQGGVYVVANIRGGGEYGPRWHQAALKVNRLKAYQDFAAVAQDLINRGVTRKEQLGIQGGSNGGLLVGNMVALYPELFQAAVCQVPLLDMRRYHLLLAGASWMAEYGNPDGGDWEFIRTYSPYQNIRSDVRYPAVLFMTSTRDDRVHPGHARKMMALMEAQGHDVQYYENIEGGHGGAANNEQRAFMQALAYSYLKERLFFRGLFP